MFDSNYPVDDKDYVIQELSHPNRNFAFVKKEKGIQYWEVYILSFNYKIRKNSRKIATSA